MKKNSITARQLSNEIKLVNLIPRENRMISELKRLSTMREWKAMQSMVAEINGLNEAEAVTDDQIEQLIKKAAAELKLPTPTKVDADAIEKGEDDAIQADKAPIKEALGTALILGAPTMLNIIAKIIDWLYRLFKLNPEEKKKWDEDAAALRNAKKTGKTPDGKDLDDSTLHHMEDELFKSKAGKAVSGLGHKLHDLYVKPLRVIIAGILWMGGQEKGLSMVDAYKQAKKSANIIFAIIMIGVAGYGAFSAITAIPDAASAVQSTGGVTKLATATLDTLKGKDMTAAVLKAIAGHVHI